MRKFYFLPFIYAALPLGMMHAACLNVNSQHMALSTDTCAKNDELLKSKSSFKELPALDPTMLGAVYDTSYGGKKECCLLKETYFIPQSKKKTFRECMNNFQRRLSEENGQELSSYDYIFIIKGVSNAEDHFSAIKKVKKEFNLNEPNQIKIISFFSCFSENFLVKQGDYFQSFCEEYYTHIPRKNILFFYKETTSYSQNFLDYLSSFGNYAKHLGVKAKVLPENKKKFIDRCNLIRFRWFAWKNAHEDEDSRPDMDSLLNTIAKPMQITSKEHTLSFLGGYWFK